MSVRVQLQLSEADMDRLRKLKANTEASSYAEVIRRVMRAYEVLSEARGRGGSLLLRNQDGSEKELVLL